MGKRKGMDKKDKIITDEDVKKFLEEVGNLPSKFSFDLSHLIKRYLEKGAKMHEILFALEMTLFAYKQQYVENSSIMMEATDMEKEK